MDVAVIAVEAVVVPRAGVRPYANHQEPDRPCGLMDPATLADVPVMALMLIVATSGT